MQNYACRVTRRRGKRSSNTRLEYRGIVKYVFLLKRLLAGRRSRWQKKTKKKGFPLAENSFRMPRCNLRQSRPADRCNLHYERLFRRTVDGNCDR